MGALKNAFSGLIGGLAEPIADVAKKFVVDRDKQIELEHEINKLVMASVASAREHDKASYGITFVDAVRGLVRPVITMFSFGTYVYAKVNGLELSELDYALLSTPMVFWFGGRRLDKGLK